MAIRVCAIQLISYIVFMIVEFLFAGGGHGSYVPYIIFWGFSGIPFILYSNWTGLSFWAPPIIQSVAIGIFMAIISEKNNRLEYFSGLVLGHLVGVGIALHLYGTSESFSKLPSSFVTKAYLAAIIIDIFYWALLFQLSRKRKTLKVRPHNS